MFQAPATIGKIQTLSDGGSKIDIFVQELSPEDAAVLFSFRGKAGNVGFKDASGTHADVQAPLTLDIAQGPTPSPKPHKKPTTKPAFDRFFLRLS